MDGKSQHAPVLELDQGTFAAFGDSLSFSVPGYLEYGQTRARLESGEHRWEEMERCDRGHRPSRDRHWTGAVSKRRLDPVAVSRQGASVHGQWHTHRYVGHWYSSGVHRRRRTG